MDRWRGAGTQNAAGDNSLTDPLNDAANWTVITAAAAGAATAGTLANHGDVGSQASDETTNVANEGDGTTNPPVNFFSVSPWQAANPAEDASAAVDVTARYNDTSNTSYWSRTHYSELRNRTVDTSYTYGDNIFYQGKHYIYTSHLDSNDPVYVSPTEDGYTEFEDLLRLGAVRELPMYVDTIGGGGGSDLPEGIYYRPNQNLEFIDRLPNTGTVRTNSIERRTDAPLPPGDEIYNSADDQFYGGLNAGNDGIFGTLDDFYATTSDPNVAKAGAHVDADADNNKDLLDTANGLEDFSVADFVDYIQSLANVRAINGGTQSRLGYATRILEENEINLGAATSRIMDADMAYESTKLAQQNVLLQQEHPW